MKPIPNKKYFLFALAGAAALLIALAIVAAKVWTPTQKKPSHALGESVIESPVTVIGSDAPEVVPVLQTIKDPELIWSSQTDATPAAGLSGEKSSAAPKQESRNFTQVSTVKRKNGSLGVLTIQKLGLSVNIYESEDNNMEAMTKGVAHFPSTSAWQGNVGFSAHNINFDGSAGYFLNLYQLKEGDEITYETDLGTRTYIVSKISTIDQEDWSPLSPTEENMVTLITCISGKPAQRLCIQALEKVS